MKPVDLYPKTGAAGDIMRDSAWIAVRNAMYNATWGFVRAAMWDIM